jgi:hypothetical protein
MYCGLAFSIYTNLCFSYKNMLNTKHYDILNNKCQFYQVVFFHLIGEGRRLRNEVDELGPGALGHPGDRLRGCHQDAVIRVPTHHQGSEPG